MAVFLEMVSDIVCPWCWLGLRRLESALDRVDGYEVEVVFRPFELDPSIPKDGLPYKDYMAAKFGDMEREAQSQSTKRYKAMREMLESYGKAENIPFAFSGIDIRPNTSDAHRLMIWAQGQGKGRVMKEALFYAYFTAHKDIGAHDILADIAAENGLDRDLVTDLLTRNADQARLDTNALEIREMGIQGVPVFIANRKLAIQGVYEVDQMLDFLDRAAANPVEAV